MSGSPIETYIQKLADKLGLDQLSEREKIVLGLGGMLILGIVIYQFALEPYMESRSRLQRSIVKKESELQDIKLLREEYKALRVKEGGIKASLAKRSPTFTLFTFIDRQASKAGVKQFIKYMKPSVVKGDNVLDESVVEMKLQELTLEQLVRFLELTESSENVVSIKRLSVQTSAKQQGYLDVIMQVATFVETQ